MAINKEKLLKLLTKIEQDDKELSKELREIRNSDQLIEEARTIAPDILSDKDTVLESFSTSDALETIVLRVGRPVLTIVNNETQLEFFDAESEVWRARVVNAKDQLLATIPSVGRIELLHHPIFDWVGTGWLVRENVIVTNRHVAELFGRRNGSTFVFREGVNGDKIDASIDLLEEKGRTEEFVFQLDEILHIEAEPGPDIAFLSVKPGGSRNIPNPIALAKQAMSGLTDVAVIGYPAKDSRIPDQQLMEQIFGDVYDKKRLAPGKVTQVTATRLFHDCSTLGGCSGGSGD